MYRRNTTLLTLVATVILPALMWAQADVKVVPTGKTLRIKLNYTGAGSVDERHKIYVLVFDSDPYTAETLVEMGSQPARTDGGASPTGRAPKICTILGRQGATGKDKTLTFSDLKVSLVYAVAFFDKTGAYDGHSDPTSGSPMGVYGTKPGRPEPIKLGEEKAVEVLLAFDDSSATP